MSYQPGGIAAPDYGRPPKKSRAGLFIACVAAVLISALAAPQIRWREAPVVALVLAIFCTLLFGYALRLPLPVWPQ